MHGKEKCLLIQIANRISTAFKIPDIDKLNTHLPHNRPGSGFILNDPGRYITSQK